MIEKLTNILWQAGVSVRNSRFDRADTFMIDELPAIKEKYFKVRADAFVVSIGNISMGGTGKTPFIITLINEFLNNQSYKIAVITKGYKRKIKKNLIITNETIENHTIDEFGDEPFYIHQVCQVPVAVSHKKYEGLYLLQKEINPDIVVIDDGFQHRWIDRDLDIVILDNYSINHLNFPPFGKMRESIDSLKRASLVLLPEDLERHPRIEEFGYKFVRFNIQSEYPEMVIQASPEYSEKHFAFTGIANPHKFIETLNQHRIEVINQKFYSDHHNYTIEDVNYLINFAKKNQCNLVTTEKDYVKLIQFEGNFLAEKINLFVQKIHFNIIDKHLLYNFLNHKIKIL